MEEKGNTGGAAVEAPAAENPTKKVAKSKAKPQRSKAHHPPTSEMVHAAIKELKDRKGSSVQAIKKYIASTYKVDGEKFAPFIKRYLKSAVTSGAVVQTRGKGASGSFKLNTGKLETKAKIKTKPVRKVQPKKEKSVEKKTVVARKPVPQKKAAPAKKAIVESSKKAAATKKPAAKPVPAKSKAAAESKSVSKSKKTAKAPAAKTKTPKPKKAAPTKSAKASAKK